MVKCIICGKEPAGYCGLCKSCIDEVNRQARGVAVEQQEEENILNDIETVAGLSEGTTNRSAKRAAEAMMNIMVRLRRANDEEKQKSKAEKEKEIQQEQAAKEIAED